MTTGGQQAQLRATLTRLAAWEIRSRQERQAEAPARVPPVWPQRLLGLALSAPVGLATGYATLALVFGGALLLDVTPGAVLVQALPVALAPVMALAAMIVLEHDRPSMLAIAGAAAWFAVITVPTAARLTRSLLGIVPPDWMLAAAL